MRHQIVLGHHRQCGEPGLVDGVRVDASQPLTVPRRRLDGDADQPAQLGRAVGGQPLRGPGQPISSSFNCSSPHSRTTPSSTAASM
jgi:hypothetical protein